MKENDELLYGTSADEETNIFNRRGLWSPKDALDEKYDEFLRPHSTPYFSRLRPFFSFEVKKLEALNQFSHVLFQDGLVFLLRFFHRFPAPKGLQTKIFIHKKLAWIVPQEWKNQIMLYERVANRDKNVVVSKLSQEKVLLIVDLHDLESAKNSFLDKQEQISGKEILLMSFYNVMRGEDISHYDRGEELRFLDDLRPHFKSMTHVSWSDIDKFSNIPFCNLNEGGVYFCDSYVSHLLMMKGTREIGQKDSDDGDLISLSPYHSFLVEEFNDSRQDSSKRNKLFEELSFPRGELFKSEPQIERGIEDYFKIKYYTPQFFNLCHYLNSLK